MLGVLVPRHQPRRVWLRPVRHQPGGGAMSVSDEAVAKLADDIARRMESSSRMGVAVPSEEIGQRLAGELNKRGLRASVTVGIVSKRDMEQLEKVHLIEVRNKRKNSRTVAR